MDEQRDIPPMGFGTFGRTGEAGIAAILHALETGYRHLDTAQSYGTQVECGEALRRSGLSRAEVFITTKVGDGNCRGGRLVPSLRKSLDELGIEQVDLTLIHWPVSPAGRLDMATYLPELAEAQELGLTRLIGVSNFTIADLEEARSILGAGKLATNQFERHPYLQNDRLVDHCGANGIAVTCYLPLARGACADDPVIEPIARRHGATAHQVALAFSLAQGHIVIPTSGRHERIEENFSAQQIRLTPDELIAIKSVDRGARQIDPVWAPAWD
jgi:2,5-diketo-D-gluconate reductase B